MLLFFSSCVWLFATSRTVACQTHLFSTISQSLLKFMSIESVILSNYLILCHPLLLLPSIFPSIRVFSNESTLCMRWPKYWSFSFSISPSNEYSGLIFFRIDWLDLLAVQKTFKSLLQHHSPKASILRHSAFFIVQLSHPYMTTGKTMAWTMNFQMFKLDLERAEEPKIKLPSSVGSSKKQESSRKTSPSALLTMPKSLTVSITTNCGKFFTMTYWQINGTESNSVSVQKFRGSQCLQWMKSMCQGMYWEGRGR